MGLKDYTATKVSSGSVSIDLGQSRMILINAAADPVLVAGKGERYKVAAHQRDATGKWVPVTLWVNPNELRQLVSQVPDKCKHTIVRATRIQQGNTKWTLLHFEFNRSDSGEVPAVQAPTAESMAQQQAPDDLPADTDGSSFAPADDFAPADGFNAITGEVS